MTTPTAYKTAVPVEIVNDTERLLTAFISNIDADSFQFEFLLEVIDTIFLHEVLYESRVFLRTKNNDVSSDI